MTDLGNNVKTIGFARVKLDVEYVSGVGFDIHDAHIAAAMAAQGIGVKLYRGRPEGRASDLVRQLLRQRTEAYHFCVTPYNAAPTLQLLRGIDALQPHAEFFLSGPLDGANDKVAAALRERSAWQADTDPGVIAAWLCRHAACAPAALSSPSSSPYLSGLLTVHDVVQTGLLAGPLLAAELQWLATQSSADAGPVPIWALQLAAPVLQATLDLLLAQGGGRQYRLHADSSAFTAAVYAQCAPALVTAIALDGADLAPDLQAQLATDPRCTIDNGARRTARCQLYGTNGHLALRTGSYFDAKQLPSLNHLELDADLAPAARRAAYAWAASDLDLRSAVVLRATERRYNELLPDLRTPALAETDGWPKHAYVLVAEPHAAQARLALDGKSVQFESADLPLAQLGAAGSTLRPGVQYFLQIRDSADVAALRARLALFERSGELHGAPPAVNLAVDNRCRWGVNGSCRVHLMRRLQVGPQGEVSTCRDTPAIGSTAQRYDDLVLEARKRQQLATVRRDCATCPVRSQCSQCSQMPEAFAGQYCEIRRAYPNMTLFFDMLGLPAALMPLLGDGSVAAHMQVSSAGMANRFYGGACGTARTGERPQIIAIGGQYIVWWRQQRRLLRISQAMAVIAEAWWTGAADADLCASLSAQFNVTADDAGASLATARTNLQQQGVIGD
ncbi:hypothetical protein ASF61_14200 [Duganella sp. Leaf126]|uniref:hypothetical protein n=1 Tax=Duganella sp. Leaf126 TaxID=1736266 RepID=UPI00070147A1|nr:hypothetical protein [Duganella sp. Leaf126]KQQ32688.1 hypothetical protein ASF61_14200 [Duganella sp. Leaf126]